MANTQYQLEGNAPQLYERETVHTLGRPLADLMFAHVALQPGDRVLDAACGTGIVTRVAVQRFRHLAHMVGVDLNPGMLDVARAHTPTPGVPVAWGQGDLGALPFPARRFDVVLCQQGLQFVPDPGAALREMRRVLVPGGRLAFTVFSEVPVYYAVLADALARHVSTAAATSCLSRYTLQEATMLRTLVDAAGFGASTIRVLEVQRRMPACAASIVEAMARAPYARDVAAVEDSFVNRRLSREKVMTYQILRLLHLIGAILIGAGLIGVCLSDLRARQVQDLPRFGEAIRNIAVFYDGLVVPGALLLAGSGTWLIVTVYGGWNFLKIPWLAGMVGLFTFEFIEGNTVTRLYFRRILRLTRAALATGQWSPALQHARAEALPTFTHFLDLPLLLVIVALGATRPNTWTVFGVGIGVAVLIATVLTLLLPHLYPWAPVKHPVESTHNDIAQQGAGGDGSQRRPSAHA